MFAALNKRDLDAEAREKLRELAGYRPATEHDERFRQSLERKRVIARDITSFAKRGQWRRCDPRTGGDDEMRCGECSSRRESALIFN